MIGEANKIVILITTSTEEEAHRIADLLLNQRKAACINILPVDSLFWWQGRLEKAKESLLIVKTRASLLPEVIALVKGAHSYQIPEIIALPILGGNEDYLKWIDSEVKG